MELVLPFSVKKLCKTYFVHNTHIEDYNSVKTEREVVLVAV